MTLGRLAVVEPWSSDDATYAVAVDPEEVGILRIDTSDISEGKVSLSLRLPRGLREKGEEILEGVVQALGDRATTEPEDDLPF